MLAQLNAACRLTALLVALSALTPIPAHAAVSNVQFVGTVGYDSLGFTTVLTANQVKNFSSGGFSGTLRMELWAFFTPFTGSSQIGYKLAQYSLGQLFGGFSQYFINSGVISYSPPPNGTWRVAMILTEFDLSIGNDGYGTRDWVNFTLPLVIGVGAPGALSIDPLGPLAFADQLLGTTSPPQAIVVKNIGGSAVTIRSVEVTNTANFHRTTNCPLYLSPGATCTVSVTFAPVSLGLQTAVVGFDNDGVGNPQFLGLVGHGIAVAAGVSVAIEYYHAQFDHYFITVNSDEIAKLDSGYFAGWTRTSQSFKVYTSPQAGLASVCRFFTLAFPPSSSHFYAPRGLGCEGTLTNKDWQLEGDVFYTPLPSASGTCPAGAVPVYRLYNSGRGGAPNHRFTTSTTIRSQMLALGYQAEGSGIGVGMCSPL